MYQSTSTSFITTLCYIYNYFVLVTHYIYLSTLTSVRIYVYFLECDRVCA